MAKLNQIIAIEKGIKSRVYSEIGALDKASQKAELFMTNVVPVDPPSNEQLRSIATLAADQVSAEDEVARLEKLLCEAKNKLHTIRDERLPQAMTEVGLSDFTLRTGYAIQVGEHYRCGQLDDAPDDDKGLRRPLAERVAALRWLDDNKHGALARRVVTVTLGSGSFELAQEIVALVRSHRKGNELLVENRRTVPWNTLAAFTKEQITTHHDVPLDVLGVTVQRSAKITRPEQQCKGRG